MREECEGELHCWKVGEGAVAVTFELPQATDSSVYNHCAYFTSPKHCHQHYILLFFPHFHVFTFKFYALSHLLRLIQENACSVTHVSQSKMLICPSLYHEGVQKVEIRLHTFLTTAVNGGERSALCPGHFLPSGKSITFTKTFLVNIMIFWEVMPCALVYSYQQFRKQEIMKLLQHSHTCLPDSTALHPSSNVNLYEDLNSHVSYLYIFFSSCFGTLCVW